MDRMVIQELSDETLVYDLERNRALCLNRTSALVWRYCDGRTSFEQVESVLERELELPDGEEAVWIALRQLQRNHLLRDGLNVPETAKHYTRRVFLTKMARVGAAVMVPMIISIVAPTAAHAATCINVPCRGKGQGGRGSGDGRNGGFCPEGSVPGQACGPPDCTCVCKKAGAILRCTP